MSGENVTFFWAAPLNIICEVVCTSEGSVNVEEEAVAASLEGEGGVGALVEVVAGVGVGVHLQS